MRASVDIAGAHADREPILKTIPKLLFTLALRLLIAMMKKQKTIRMQTMMTLEGP